LRIVHAEKHAHDVFQLRLRVPMTIAWLVRPSGIRGPVPVPVLFAGNAVSGLL